MGQKELRIETKKISELKFAEYNPRKISKRELELLKDSLQEFGHVSPILWNEATGNIVGGNQRVLALKSLGYSEIICVVINIDAEKEKRLNLILNKASAKWDNPKLYDLLLGLENISVTGFNKNNVADFFQHAYNKYDKHYFGDTRERTYNKYRLNEYDETRTKGSYDFPRLNACHYIPETLISFNEVKSLQHIPPNCGVHFFIDDYQFERIWRSPYKYFERLKKFDCVITPDFSTYYDMPIAMKIWNLYRMRLIGQMMQDAGLVVIPHIRFINEHELESSLEGIEPCGVIADSTVGIVKSQKFRELFILGMNYAIEKLKPECVIVYGHPIDYEFTGTTIKYIKPRGFAK